MSKIQTHFLSVFLRKIIIILVLPIIMLPRLLLFISSHFLFFKFLQPHLFFMLCLHLLVICRLFIAILNEDILLFLQIYLHLFFQKEVVVLTSLSSSLVVRLEKLVAGESILFRFNLECKSDFVVFRVITIFVDLWRVSDLSGVEKFKLFHHDCGDISDGFAAF